MLPIVILPALRPARSRVSAPRDCVQPQNRHNNSPHHQEPTERAAMRRGCFPCHCGWLNLTEGPAANLCLHPA
jgi:hypothetical protein